MPTRSFASRFESGSSSRNACGWRTIARPIATRCRCPPESCAGRRSSSSASPSSSATSSTRRAISGLRRPPRLQPVAEVLAHGHVRVERVGLEDHRDVAAARREVGDVAVADRDLAAGHLLEARRSSAAASTCRSRTGPTRTRNSPSAISRETSSTAVTDAERPSSRCSSRIAAIAGDGIDQLGRTQARGLKSANWY